MKKTFTRVLISLAITAVLGGLFFYFALPAINVFDQGFWMALGLGIVVFFAIYFFISAKQTVAPKGVKIGFKQAVGKKAVTVAAILVAIPILVLIVGNIFSSTFFNAEKYSGVIEVPEAVFEEDMPETTVVSNIALMDSATAQTMGERTLGALSDVVSQYEISPNYKQINYGGAPQKVSNLEYADFFKWMSNREQGIPGYVMVDPVNVTEANYIKLSSPIKYADSAFFGEDLHRKLRMTYPTKIFGNFSFEIDDSGNPYYIVSCMAPKVFLFGAMDVSEVIIFNPIDGSSDIYSLEDTPSWVDNVFTGDLAAQKYDWFGTLKNGFWNSIIGNKDCKVTTDDFGYIVIGDDVWFFTGVTSVTSDESNIGFIISNARTGEYKFYPVIGAEEYSAMLAAEGEVQEKGYVASFPSLINVSGEATYIMVLKDSGGLVKLYALVNVEKYSIVATGTTQTEAKQEYLKLLKQNGIISDTPQSPDEQIPTKDVTVNEVRIATVGDDTVVYVMADDGALYKQSVSADESVMRIKKDDVITVSYYETDVDMINQIVEWKFFVAEDQE